MKEILVIKLDTETIKINLSKKTEEERTAIIDEMLEIVKPLEYIKIDDYVIRRKDIVYLGLQKRKFYI